jgi:hypothetical protein
MRVLDFKKARGESALYLAERVQKMRRRRGCLENISKGERGEGEDFHARISFLIDHPHLVSCLDPLLLLVEAQ